MTALRHMWLMVTRFDTAVDTILGHFINLLWDAKIAKTYLIRPFTFADLFGDFSKELSFSVFFHKKLGNMF